MTRVITNGQAIRLTAAVLNVMIPSARIVLFHGNEISVSPRLPINRPVQPIRDETAPVSRFLLLQHHVRGRRP